jgi:hypothetical protein
MKRLLSLLAVIVSLGVVDAIDNNIVRIELMKGGHSSIFEENVVKFPCKLKEGDMVVAVDIKNVRVYKCIPKNRKDTK